MWTRPSCDGLTEIAIPNSVTTVGDSVFSRCDKLTIQTPKHSAAEKYAEKNGSSASTPIEARDAGRFDLSGDGTKALVYFRMI